MIGRRRQSLGRLRRRRPIIRWRVPVRQPRARERSARHLGSQAPQARLVRPTRVNDLRHLRHDRHDQRPWDGGLADVRRPPHRETPSSTLTQSPRGQRPGRLVVGVDRVDRGRGAAAGDGGGPPGPVETHGSLDTTGLVWAERSGLWRSPRGEALSLGAPSKYVAGEVFRRPAGAPRRGSVAVQWVSNPVGDTTPCGCSAAYPSRHGPRARRVNPIAGAPVSLAHLGGRDSRRRAVVRRSSIVTIMP